MLLQRLMEILINVKYQNDAGTKTALNKLYRTISKQENAHPEAALLVDGDFNAGKLKSYQHVTCATRGEKNSKSPLLHKERCIQSSPLPSISANMTITLSFYARFEESNTEPCMRASPVLDD